MFEIWRNVLNSVCPKIVCLSI